MVCDGEVEDNYNEEARVSLVAVAEPFEGDPYGPLIHVSVVRSAFSRTKGGGREPAGHVPGMRQPSFFLWVFVGTDAVHSSGSILPLGGSDVPAIGIVNQEGSLLGKCDTAVEGAWVVAVEREPQRISLGPARIACAAVAMVVHRDK